MAVAVVVAMAVVWLWLWRGGARVFEVMFITPGRVRAAASTC